FMLNEFYEASQDAVYIQNLYHTFIVPCANFLTKYVDEETGLPHASYDLWEEHFATFTYTVCVVIGGLEAAAKLSDLAEEPQDAVAWRRSAAGMRDKLDTLRHAEGYFRKSYLLVDGKPQNDDGIDAA